MDNIRKNKLKVVELFAGVGGFRLGLESSDYEIVWSNQWEPSTKRQHASEVYEARFGSENHSNEDIETVPTSKIPDHDLLCGGFPCQDYSVATTLKNSKGLVGKKGVLWWSIYRILNEKKLKPNYLILENVDRLIKSPSTQRGKDFAIMLKSLDNLGYAVEWRVINAADYGMPQRRRRIFIIGYYKSSKVYKNLLKQNKRDWILHNGLIAKAFPVQSNNLYNTEKFKLNDDIIDISNNFNLNGKTSPFKESGTMIEGEVSSMKTEPLYSGTKTVLGDIIQHDNVNEECYIEKSKEKDWEYLKGSKTIQRISKDGFDYKYSEGKMIYPDSLDNPSRTIITGEGGKSPSRFKHVIRNSKGLRRLTPVELERLNMFPDNHTRLDGITDTKRAFFMGNALVVGIVKKLGEKLSEII